MFLSKNRHWISGIVAAISCLFIYLVGKNILVGIVCGIIAFVALMMLFKKEVPPKPEPLQEEINKNSFQALVANTKHQLNLIDMYEDHIKNPEVKTAIHDIIDTSNRIIANVTQKPQFKDQMKDFFNYYIPVTQKILSKYSDIEINMLDSDEIREFKKKVEFFIKELKQAYDKQLECLFKDEIFDASVEMDVMKSSLKSEGLLNNDDFNRIQ